MTLVAETTVALRFFGDDLDPEMLTTRLGKPPSTCARKGEVIKSEKTGRERAARTGSWILGVERCEPGDLDTQIRDIFSGMTDDTMVWRDLAQKYHPDLFVGLFMRELNEGIEVSAESLSLLADRGIFLGLCIYGARPALRNVQIIDGAEDATFSVFQVTDSEFAQIFPVIGQDMEVSDDFVGRVGKAQAKAIFDAIWGRPVLKSDANGIHGTLYFNYASKRRYLPASKREVDFDESAINPAQRKLFGERR